MGNFKYSLIVFLLSINISWSQTVIGKLYTKLDADNIYGPVSSSVQISTGLLNNFASSTTNFIMFRINNGNLIILGDQRKPLYPSASVVSQTDEMRVFSVSLVKKLLQDGNNINTSIEIRNNNVLTLTNGNSTLEYSAPCPPYCTGE